MSLEPKKLALIRIFQILEEYSDADHPLTQEDIAKHLEKDYGIVIERKAISRNLSLLKEAGVDIGSGRSGSYLTSRDFENSELHLLIDGILCSRHISATHSKDLIERICGLSNKYFKSGVKSIYSVNDWNKTDNQALFYNIELIDEAIESGRQISYDYNKYGVDKRLHKSAHHVMSPYQMVLSNQRYYLMAHSEKWKNMAFHKLDRITNMEVLDVPATPIRSVPGYEKGIDYKELSTGLPYLFTDRPTRIELLANTDAIDQLIEWFGKDIRINPVAADPDKVSVSIIASPNAMEFWALQYVHSVEVVSPEFLRNRIKETLEGAVEKYK
jgi:predicted DNA-binding transcriptional regulator YafY